MTDLTKLSRRERQIMEILFAQRKATVNDICAGLPDPPTPMAVRRMLSILQEKGFIKRQKRGREYVYLPKQSKQGAGVKALRQVLETFFDGSIGTAVATHLEKPGSELSEDDVKRLRQLIRDLSQNKGDT